MEYERAPEVQNVFTYVVNFHDYLFIWLFRATTAAYGSFQTRGQIGATAAGLCHSHSNAESKLCLQPTPQPTAVPDP